MIDGEIEKKKLSWTITGRKFQKNKNKSWYIFKGQILYLIFLIN
jgi:hypothetical protein